MELRCNLEWPQNNFIGTGIPDTIYQFLWRSKLNMQWKSEYQKYFCPVFKWLPFLDANYREKDIMCMTQQTRAGQNIQHW